MPLQLSWGVRQSISSYSGNRQFGRAFLDGFFTQTTVTSSLSLPSAVRTQRHARKLAELRRTNLLPTMGTGSRHATAPATASWASISGAGADAHQESHSGAPDGRESLLCAERPLWQGGSYVAPDGRPLAGVSRRSATAIAPARRANAGSLGDAVAGRRVTRALPVLLYGAMCVLLATSGYSGRRTPDGPGAYPPQ